MDEVHPPPGAVYLGFLQDVAVAPGSHRSAVRPAEAVSVPVYPHLGSEELPSPLHVLFVPGPVLKVLEGKAFLGVEHVLKLTVVALLGLEHV